MSRYFCAVLLGAALLGTTAFADDEHHEKAKRYYDRERKDYHEWNEHENQAYRHYMEENHRQYHDWAKANRREQQDYWKWRHDHPDDRR
jgi:ribulose kinase